MISRFLLAALGISVLVQTSSSQECALSKPLGLVSGEVQDWQITSSSTYPLTLERSCHERFARLFQPNGHAWCAKFKSNSEWLQIDFGVETLVTQFATQGRCNGDEWVSELMLSYSLDSFNWRYVVDVNSANRVFEANSDAYTVKYVYLESPISARFVKFHVVRWNKHPSLRVELFGCQACRSFIGYPPFGRITASSQQSGAKSCSPNDGTIFSNRAWCAKSTPLPNQPVSGNANQREEWLQIDVGPPTRITGIVTKGRGDTKKKQWVTRYRVAFSNDSLNWAPYRDAPNLNIKIFAGNVDKDTERVHYVNQPFTARYVRIYPLSWNEHISMRVGILGCPQVADCGPGFFRISPSSPCVPNLAYQRESGVVNVRALSSPLRRVSRENSYASLTARVASESRFRNQTNSPVDHCTVLQSSEPSITWLVKLTASTPVRGVILNFPQNGIFVMPGSFITLHVSVSDSAMEYNNSTTGAIAAAAKQCSSVTLHGRIQQKRVLMQCSQELMGRFVYLNIAISSKPSGKPFTFTLCNLSVF